MMNKKIDFILRSDAKEKNGGDSFQVDHYRELLMQCGYDVRLVPFDVAMVLRENAIVHIVNVDRPYDFLATVRLAGDRQIVVSTIHHDLSSVRAMRKAERNQGIRSVAGRYLSEAGREFLAFSVRTAQRIRSFDDFFKWAMTVLRAVPSVPSVWHVVGRTLDRVDAVALLAEGERRSLTRDTGWQGRNGVLIPNGKPDGSPASAAAERPRKWSERAVEICVVGRVEPRKRQLEVARAAVERGQSILFVGPPSPSSPRYVHEFEDVIAKNGNLQWLGGVEHDDVLALMGDSRVLLNASWVEVQSLVDIEGAAAGCWVLTGKGGNSQEWLGESIVVVDSHSVDELLEEAAKLIDLGVEPGPSDYVQTWELATATLVKLYDDLRAKVGTSSFDG